jgi:hypothetical protein
MITHTSWGRSKPETENTTNAHSMAEGCSFEIMNIQFPPSGAFDAPSGSTHRSGKALAGTVRRDTERDQPVASAGCLLAAQDDATVGWTGATLEAGFDSWAASGSGEHGPDDTGLVR